MIEIFGIENYLSFKDFTFIDFRNESGDANNLSMIYGMNASGKSNLYVGFFHLISILKNGIQSDMKNRRFKLLEKDMQKRNMQFYIAFVIENRTFTYQLVIDTEDSTISSEILTEVINDEEIILLDKEEGTYQFLDETKVKIVDSYDADKVTRLSLIQKLEVETMLDSKIYRTIYSFLTSNIAGETLDFDERRSLKNLYEDSEKKKKVLEQIKKYSVGISDIVIERKENKYSETEAEQVYNEFSKEVLGIDVKTLLGENELKKLVNEKIDFQKESYDLRIVHNQKYDLFFGDESTGTRIILDYLISIFSSEMKVYFIDEFEDSLHTAVIKELLQYMNEEKLGKQFIFTTHALDNLEYKFIKEKTKHFFVTKNTKGESSITRVDELEGLRTDGRHNWKKMYLENKLVDVPQFMK